MSLVSHDSSWTKNYGVVHGTNIEEQKKKNYGRKSSYREDNAKDKYDVNKEVAETYQNVASKKTILNSLETETHKEVGNDIEELTRNVSVSRRAKVQDSETNEIIGDLEHNINDIYNKTNGTKYADNLLMYKTTNDKKITNIDSTEVNKKLDKNRNKNRHETFKKESLKTSPDIALKRTNYRITKAGWSWNSGILMSLMMLNVVGRGLAEETSSFTSGLTSRMIASFLGYSSTCTLGNEVRPCSLTLSCWLRGGTRLRGCGGWLFSCCGPPDTGADTLSNSIPSSDWKYKSPPKLRQVPQRNGMPNNVFRRRVDDDVTQLDCGLPSSRILQKRIIGGREARFAEFPWQAHVRISEFQCGGVLVSRRYVATAAHCVSRAHTRDIAVWLGAIDTSATHHPARKLGVIQKILHPLFQFRMTQPDRYDVALLKLSRPVTYMSHILPICLPDYDLDLRGRSGVIAGWGKTDASNGHTGTNLLRSATVPILSKEQCINWHQSKQISVEIHSEMICAGHSDGHQDACLGDSGGPLIVLDNGRYYLVGITSAGFGCGVDHQPGIYHNVKLTANWIRSVITPSVGYNDNYLK